MFHFPLYVECCLLSAQGAGGERGQKGDTGGPGSRVSGTHVCVEWTRLCLSF